MDSGMMWNWNLHQWFLLTWAECQTPRGTSDAPREFTGKSFGFMLYYMIQIQSRINWQVSLSHWKADTFTSAKHDFTFLILLFPMKLRIWKQKASSSNELLTITVTTNNTQINVKNWNLDLVLCKWILSNDWISFYHFNRIYVKETKALLLALDISKH